MSGSSRDTRSASCVQTCGWGAFQRPPVGASRDARADQVLERLTPVRGGRPVGFERRDQRVEVGCRRGGLGGDGGADKLRYEPQ